MINKVILVGNVGQDPEVRYTGDVNNGTKVATIRLATTERYRDRNNNLQEHTEWHNVVAWENSQMTDLDKIIKGAPVNVTGRLRVNRYTSADGTEKQYYEIMANKVRFLRE